MRKFLYLCLMGTALVGSASVFQARSELVNWVRGDGMGPVEKGLTSLPRAAVNIGRGLTETAVDGVATLGRGLASGAEYVADGIGGFFSPSAPSITFNPTTGLATDWNTGITTNFNTGEIFGPGLNEGLYTGLSPNSIYAQESGGFFSNIGSSLLDGYHSVSNWVTGATDGLMGAPARLGQGVSDFFVNATNNPNITGTGEAGILTPQGMWNGAKSAWNSATEGAGNLWNGTKDMVGSWFSSGSNTAGGALSSASPILQNEMGTFTSSGVQLNDIGGGLLGGSDGNFYANIGGNAVPLSSSPIYGDEMGMFTASGVELTPMENGLLQGSDGLVYQDVGGEAVQMTPAQQKLAQQGQEAGSTSGKATSEAASAMMPDKATVFNVIQYAIVIMQALEATNQEDISKEVKVKAQELQDSQGSVGASTIAGMIPDASLSASSISAAAQAMIALLQNNPVYPDLLSDDVCLQAGTSTGSGTASGETFEDVRLTTAYKQCMQRRRSAFAHTVALSAQVIAEGSNAISAEFYDRIQTLANAAKTTIGTLGSMSVVNDSERFPYFEMVRGTALSAVQLEVRAAGTLNELNSLRKGERHE